MAFASATLAALAAACSVASPPQTVALVELYTSQGCSSCPPADRWLSKIRPSERIVPLALHVSYWDYIGWKDPFARREFNERQRRLAERNGSRTVYTPGVFLQGEEFRRWSDAAGFDAAVRAINAQPAAARIELTVRIDGGVVESRASVTAASARPQLFLALVQSGNSTQVKAGENRGETLANDHVVANWSGPLPSGEAVRWTLPDVARERLRIVALAQDPGRAQPLQTVALPLTACGSS